MQFQYGNSFPTGMSKKTKFKGLIDKNQFLTPKDAEQFEKNYFRILQNLVDISQISEKLKKCKIDATTCQTYNKDLCYENNVPKISVTEKLHCSVCKGKIDPRKTYQLFEFIRYSNSLNVTWVGSTNSGWGDVTRIYWSRHEYVRHDWDK